MDLSFEDVSYSYGEYGEPGLNPPQALDRLNVTFAGKQLTVVLGAPGSGKSTLLQHMNGLLRPDEGRMRVGVPDDGQKPGRSAAGLAQTDGSAAQAGGESGSGRTGKLRRLWAAGRPAKRQELRKPRKSRKSGVTGDVPPDLRRRVGLVFQFPEHQLFEDTVERDLRFGPLNFGAGEAEAAEAAQRAADTMGLGGELLRQSPLRLSSGQMRKAAVAAVLSAEPAVLVLDEPTASLDPQSREELLRLLHRLCREHGRTVIVVTHRLDEVLPYADEFVVLKQGRCVFQGDAAALLGRPAVLAEAGLVPPPSMRLAARIAEGLGMSPPDVVQSAAEQAEWIAAALDRPGGRLARRENP